MRLSELDFDLPQRLIAQRPLPQRDASRLLVVDRATQTLAHQHFRDLPALLRPGDRLVLNNSRVIPARLVGHKAATGGRVELLLLRPTEPGCWQALLKPGRRLRTGTVVVIDDLRAVCRQRLGDGLWEVAFDPPERLPEVLAEVGRMPLPPYIHERLDEPERYQTVYARHEGSAAAPTAGLHFTEHLLERLAARGIDRSEVTLHVGLDTFRPVQVEVVEDHPMHSEYWRLEPAVAEALGRTKAAGGRLVAVGTTAVRVLETAASDGSLHPGSGWTKLFITPGYRFRAVDALLTNFHLPRTTLLALVGAFAGPALLRRAYTEAIEQEYRLLSFGDAMLIV